MSLVLFEGYATVVFVIVCAEIALIAATFRKRPDIALTATIVSLMLKGQFIWVGNPLYAWQFTGFLGIVLQMALRRRPAGYLLTVKTVVELYFVATLMIALILWVGLAASERISALPNVTLSRAASQFVYFILILGLVMFGARMGAFVSTETLLRTIIAVATISAYFALIQTAIFLQTGMNIFPIIRGDGSMETALILDQTFRATSFVGEPKHLGLMMALGLTCLWIMRLARFSPGRFWLHRPLAMIAATVLSLSATGIYIAAAGVGGLMLFYARRVRGVDFIALTLASSVAVFFLIGAGGEFHSTLIDQASRASFELQDISVWGAVMRFPIHLITGFGLGNVHIFAVDFLPPDFPLFRDHGYKANSGLLFILGDSGLIGILLFIAPHVMILKAARKLERGDSGREVIAISALLIASLISFLLRYSEVHFLIVGVAIGVLSFVRGNSISKDHHVSSSRPPSI